MDNEMDNEYTCPICKKDFSSNSNKLKHARTIHFVDLIEDTNPNIKCSICHTTFYYKKQLREHLNDVHELNIKEEILFFDSFNDFEEWKLQEEKLNNVQFIVNGVRSKHKSNYKSFGYECKRSGFYKPTAKLRRQKKSYKINATCPAFISGKIFDEGNVQLRYLSKHTHELDKPKPNQVFLPEEVVEIDKPKPNQIFLPEEVVEIDKPKPAQIFLPEEMVEIELSSQQLEDNDNIDSNPNSPFEDAEMLFHDSLADHPLTDLFKEIDSAFYSQDDISKQESFISQIRNTIHDWKQQQSNIDKLIKSEDN